MKKVGNSKYVYMLNDEDIKKLTEVLTTKDELSKGLSDLSVEVIGNREEIKPLKENIGRLEKTTQSLVSSVDKLVI